MSRSRRAWATGCDLLGAATSCARRLRDREVVRDHLVAQREVRTACSLGALTWVSAAVVLMLAFVPAVASGKSVNRSGRVPAARAAQSASQVAVAPRKHNDQQRRGAARVELLALGSGYASADGSRAVRNLQRRLAVLGYSAGPIDGRYGPLTAEAVRRFQATHGLIVDGIDGPATRAGLTSARLVLRPGDGYVPGGSGPVRGLQHRLLALGFSPGPVDGRYGPLTERAVLRFQAARHLRVDGIAGPQTLGRLGRVQSRRAVHRPTAHRQPGPSPTRTTHNTRPRPIRKRRPVVRHPGGASLTPWLIGVACLILVALVALLWRKRQSPTEQERDEPAQGSPPTSDQVPGSPAGRLDSSPPEDPRAGAGVFRLAQVLAQAGNMAPAADALRRADRLGHCEAAFELGLLLSEEGDLAGAQEALLRAHERGHPDAAFELGELLERQGDRVIAEQAYRVGDERGHARAAFNLGVLLLHDRDVAGAEDAFRRADERGHPGAASNLGVLLEERGDVAGARAAYERADRRGEPVGAYNLGLLLEQDGDLSAAKSAYQRADERGEPAGAYKLGQLLEQQGDREGALRAYRRAGELGPSEVAEFAQTALRGLDTGPDNPDERHRMT